jgi:hypothetical protein
MFKLPGIPSPQAEIHELADFAEWLAWKQGSVSHRQILADLGRLDENEPKRGQSTIFDNEKRTFAGTANRFFGESERP